MKKLFIIGLDCAEPSLVFDEFKDELPNLRFLYENGLSGRLYSTIPPITIPAWMVMATGKDPGQLGLYGFRHRKAYSYTEIWIANSLKVEEPTVWDLLGERGAKSIIVGVPPSYPPKPVKGCMVSGFITPDVNSKWTYPEHLKERILAHTGGDYRFDILYRSEEKDRIKRELFEMTEQHFKAIDFLLGQYKDWSLFWFVEIGVDRVHHAFWRYMDPEHHLHEENSPYADVILEYYKFVDRWIGELLERVGEDAAVLVVSDHGAKRMKGCFCINEWLIEQGYLKLKGRPKGVVDLKDAEVDWERTVAWGWGGYYARVFINVKGREMKGVVEPEEYEDVRNELARELEKVRGPNGEKWENKVVKPEDVYATIKGDPPDLMAFFDDLSYRSAGTIGWETFYLDRNDKGPDDAVHDWDGLFIFYDPEGGKEGRVDARIEDIAPTILEFFELPIPEGVRGRSII